MRSKEHVSLREYFEALRQADREARAVARQDIDRRLEAMNDLRAQIESERGHYITQEMYEARHQALISLVDGAVAAQAATNTALAALQARLPAMGALVTLLSAGLGAAILRLIGG